MEQGFIESDFPSNPPTEDGKCYFAAPGHRTLAEEYHRYYKDGILEVTIELGLYRQYLQPLERPYQSGTQVELPVPHKLFYILNKSTRVLKPE